MNAEERPKVEQVEDLAPADPKPARRKKLDVKRIARNGQALCVEYKDGDWPRRAWIPVEEVHDNKAPEKVLREGLPVGTQWEKKLDMSLDIDALARALYRRGIFTKLEASNKPAVMAAIREAIGPVYKAILLAAEE